MKKTKTHDLVLYATYGALIFVARTLDHLVSGFLPINFAIITLTVALSCALLIPTLKNCVIAGFVFGVMSLLTALMFGGGAVVYGMVNPLISVLPRVIVGFVAFISFTLSYRLLQKVTAKKKAFMLSSSIACVFSAITNTITVLSMIWLFKTIEGIDALYVIFTVNAIPELIVPALIAPFLIYAVRNSMKIKDAYAQEPLDKNGRGGEK